MPLVESALAGAFEVGDNMFIVPAIFLKYKEDKYYNNALEKGVLAALYGVTIATGTSALLAGAKGVARIWAIAEMAGAIGNMGANTVEQYDPVIDSDFIAVLNAYNAVMGIIGLKNMGQGIISYCRKLKPSTKTAITAGQSIKSSIFDDGEKWVEAVNKLDNLTPEQQSIINQQEPVLAMLSVRRVGNRIVRSIEQIAPNGIIPSNSQTNNLFHKWFDDLLPEELDLVLDNPFLKEALEARIRYPSGLHEWCMVCEIKTFKSWEVSMSEIHRFRTKTLDLTGVNPITGATFTHGRCRFNGFS